MLSLHSWLSNITSLCCCYALGFQIWLPSTLRLLGSGVSNLTSNYVSATLLTFQHNFLFVVVVVLLTFKYYFLLRSCCYALGFPTQLPTTFLLLRSGLSNTAPYYVLAATLLAFQHNFRLCFCCYALGFQPSTRPTNYVSACCGYALGFPT